MYLYWKKAPASSPAGLSPSNWTSKPHPINNKGHSIRPFFSLALLLLFLASAAYSQEDPAINQQFWLDYNPRITLKDSRVGLSGSLGYRSIVPHDWNRYYMDAGINYNPFIHKDERGPVLQYLQLHFGVRDLFTQSLHDLNLNEIRFYQGIRVRWPVLRRVIFSHRLRFEQRFEKLTNSQVGNFTPRLRYRLSGKIRLLRSSLQNLYFPLSAEAFMSAGKGIYFNEVTRLTPGVGYDFSDVFALQFHMSYHFSRNSPSESFKNNDLVYRLRIYHTF